MRQAHVPAPRAALKTLPAAPTARAGAAQAGDSPQAHQAWTQGLALARAGRDAQALPHFERATRLAPRVALYWLNRASNERRLRRATQAMASAQRAFDLDRSNILACHLLAEVLRLNNRDAEALAALQALDADTPRDSQHWMLEGAVQMALHDWQPAALAFLQVLAAKPADIESYQQLGFALANLRRYGEAAECFRTVAILEPAEIGAAIYAAHYAAWACDWTQGAQDLERMKTALALQEGRADVPSFSPFCLLSMSDDAALHWRAARIEAARIAAASRDSAGWPLGRKSGDDHAPARRAIDAGRIRIGFVSADFRHHATSLLMVRALERLDRKRFEIYLYSHGVDDRSALRARVAAAADHFVDCARMNAAEQAVRIRVDGVALLIDLCGYTASSRLGVFALRPAPVQASWLAYPGSTGADYIDYVIGDPTVTPLAHAAHFSERIVQLPHSYQPTDDRRLHPQPATRAQCGLPDEAFVFASFNQSYKITEDVFDAWCRILGRVAGSVLWLLVPQEAVRAALRSRAQAHGLAPQRLIFAPFVEQAEHLARLPQADLFLDTFPYGAHTTCSDALWMGLPVLTRAGSSFASRVASSLLHAARLPQLVVDSVDSYEQRAVALATGERAELAAIRSHLHDERLALPLFDSAEFAAAFGDVSERMVSRWRSGCAPEHIPA